MPHILSHCLSFMSPPAKRAGTIFSLPNFPFFQPNKSFFWSKCTKKILFQVKRERKWRGCLGRR